MSVTAFNRRRRELAAKQLQQAVKVQKEAKPTVKGGRKNGKARKTEADTGDQGK